MEIHRDHRRPCDPVYEVLHHAAVLKLLNTEGTDAVYTRRKRVRFLQDQVTTVYGYDWGNGIPFATFDVSPGRILDRRLIARRVRTTLQLPTPQRRGDILTLDFERSIKNGCVSPSEWWLEAELYYRTEHLSLKVLLPPTRPVRSAHLMTLHTPGAKPLTVQALPNGWQNISYLVDNPVIGERYTLLWDW